LQRIHGFKTGIPPRCDLEKEKALHLALRALIHTGVVKSAHDCSEGGLAVALAESCISQQIARETPRLIGAQVDLTGLGPASTVLSENAKTGQAQTQPNVTLRQDATLFGETQGRIVITVSNADSAKVVAQAKILGVPAARIGKVGGSALVIKSTGAVLDCALDELHDLWWNSIARAMS